MLETFLTFDLERGRSSAGRQKALAYKSVQDIKDQVRENVRRVHVFIGNLCFLAGRGFRCACLVSRGRMLIPDVPPPPWSSPGASLLTLTLKLIPDRCLMKIWSLGSVWPTKLFTELGRNCQKRAAQRKKLFLGSFSCCV